MDDLKLTGRSEEELTNEIQIVRTLSNDIKMKFGWEKCARICLKSGKLYRKQYIWETMKTENKELDTMKTYKYLCVEDSHNIEHKKEKDRLKEEYIIRLRLILSTELSAKNKMQALGSLAIPVLRYSFRINWHQEEIQKLDRKTRKTLTIHGQHHPKADIDCLYVPRKDGGRGLMLIEGAYITEVIKLKEYVEHTEDPPMQTVMTHQQNAISTVFQTAINLQKSLQSDMKQIKTTITRNLRER
jgi:hypothetical protein